MTTSSRARIVAQTGLASALVKDSMRLAQVIDANYQPDGRLRPEIVQTIIPLIPIAWEAPGAFSAGPLTRRVRLPQPGAVVHLGATVTAAPSSPLTITLTGQSATAGTFTVATVQILATKFYGEVAVPVASLPAGTWLGVTVGTPYSATGLSVTAAFQGGA